MNAAPAQTSPPVERSAPTSDRICPDCGGVTANVQGLVACPRCPWIDVT